MMRATDLAPLIGQQPTTSVGFRQGTVVAWNQLTAENTIDVGGTTVTDVPVFNSSEALLIQPGDVVNILTMGSGAQSWGILGRIIIPGTAHAASALSFVSNQISAAADMSDGTRSSGSYGDLTGVDPGPSVTATIRASGKALCFWACQLGYTGAYEANAESQASVAVSGASTVAASDDFAIQLKFDELFPTGSDNQISIVLQASCFHLFTGLNPGSNTFTMKYRTGSAGGADPDTVHFLQREIAVFAL